MSKEPTQAERDRGIANGIVACARGRAASIRSERAQAALVDAIANALQHSLTDAALRYLTGPCAFEEDHAREIIEQVRGGADQEEIVRAILGIQ